MGAYLMAAQKGADVAGGIYDLIAGDPAEREEKTLGSLGNQEISTGESLVNPAATYYENILSGDPSRIAQSLSPEISAGQTQVEQQALGNANFDTRSGGTAASTQAGEAGERANIINLVGGLQSSSAGAAGSLGSSQESMGSSNEQAVANLKSGRRSQVTSDIQALGGNNSQGTGESSGNAGTGSGGMGQDLSGAFNSPTSLEQPDVTTGQEQYMPE